MNKVILGLILAVCVLGLALVLLNERLGRKPDGSPINQTVAEERANRGLPEVREQAKTAALSAPTQSQTGRQQADLSAAMAFETGEARQALAPPAIEAESPVEPALPPEGAKTAITPDSPAEAPEPVASPETPAPVVAPAEREPEKTVVKPAEKSAEKPAPKAEKPAEKPAPKAEKSAEKAAVAEKPAPKTAEKNVERFVVFSRDKGATIRIAGNTRLNFKHMILENPDRVFLDFDGDVKFPANAPGVPKNELVKSVRVGKQGDKTRVVIDLLEKPRSTRILPAKNGASVDIRVDK